MQMSHSDAPSEKDMQVKGDHMVTDEELAPVVSRAPTQVSQVFSTDTVDGPDMRGVSWFGAACLLFKVQFGLGVLGLPKTFDALGFVPGMIILLLLCVVSTWTGLFIGKFRERHPDVHSAGDAAGVLLGRWGLELGGLGLWLYYTIGYGGTILTFSIGMNIITGHAICTLGWLGIGAAIAVIGGMFTRTFKLMQYMSYAACASIGIAVWIVAIAALAQDQPADAPAGETINKDIQAIKSAGFSVALSAISTQVFSLAGHAGFFSIHAEMRHQHEYRKAFLTCQAAVCANYIIIPCILYGKVGQYIASPALRSAGTLIAQIAYGIALPALVFSTFFQAHFSAKYAFVRCLRGTKHLQSNTAVHWITWLAMMGLVLVVGFIIATVVPFFGDLISLSGALLGSTFTLTLPGALMIYEKSKDYDGFKGYLAALRPGNGPLRRTIYCWAAALTFIGGLFVTVGGVYATIDSIIQSYANGTVGSAFSCADNSGN
ncbi:hypothetical protein BDZ90DRAFT_190287 [Jaminaea rosea]|uniref:Amino acid transporter transmembrane domain-containing protein n=1 Tax=Jaminaea rosea TaxID=1569628 RepID=A0A316UPK2_9BASI|nr:hypothetical protein BDZ90DRAFT_190287 [Jaminaea rosea]PWN26708.1 hypothetical protein BDZ90DRAFT_190287 [Jaminaea rosea]